MNIDKLDIDLQRLWESTHAEAIAEGYDTTQAEAVAWAVVNWAKGVDGWRESVSVYWHYPLCRPGTYEPESGGEVTITAADVVQLGEALQRMVAIGRPCPLIFGHDTEYALGSIPACRMEGEVLQGCLVYLSAYDQGIRTGAFGLSMESLRNFTDQAYTDGKTYALWPTAWAVLPANQIPAIPPGEPLVASRQPKGANQKVSVKFTNTAPTRGSSPHGKEADAMTLEEMQKQLGGLEATLASLRTENTKLQAQVKQLTDQLQASAAELDQLKAAKVQAQLEADEAVFDGEVKDLLATIPQTGVRERVEARLKAGKDLTERRAIFANIKALHEEMAMPQAKLKAGKNIPDTHDGEHSIDTKLGEQVKAAKAMSAEKGIPYIDALRMVQRKGE